MPDPLVLAGTLLEDIDGAGPATHIDAMALGIDKHIIRIAAGIEVGTHRVVRGSQDEQPRWASEHLEHSVSVAVEGHRKVRAMAFGGHRPDDFVLRQIDDGDLPSIGHVDERPRGAVVDLKTLRVRLEPDVRNLLPALRVYDGERPLAVSDE